MQNFQVLTDILFCQGMAINLGFYWLFRIGDFEETLSTAFWINTKHITNNRNNILVKLI